MLSPFGGRRGVEGEGLPLGVDRWRREESGAVARGGKGLGPMLAERSLYEGEGEWKEERKVEEGERERELVGDDSGSFRFLSSPSSSVIISRDFLLDGGSRSSRKVFQRRLRGCCRSEREFERRVASVCFLLKESDVGGRKERG